MNQQHMENNQPKEQKIHPVAWTILVVGIALLAVGAYYFLTQEDVNTNNANIVAVTKTAVGDNINTAANTNEVTNMNTEVDTSDWLTYENEEYGYAFKYPRDWEIIETSYATIGFRPISFVATDEEWSAVYLTLYDNPGNLSISTYYEQTDGPSNLFETSLSVENREANGIKMTYFETIPGVVANSAIAYLNNTEIIEVQMHKDQIGDINNLMEIFFTIATSIQ